ncbi:MAG: DUF4340 domain-containing protein [Clostridia bacterium]|nr:DUF4340 domain-containing protein [Clostridia bacterium]
MKKYRTTIIALALIAIALAAFFISRAAGLFDNKEQPTEDPYADIETGAVFSCLAEDTAYSNVKKVVSHSPSEVIVLEKVSGDWTCTSHPSLALIPKNVNSCLNSMRTLNGRVAYRGEVTESKQYEFGFIDSEYHVVITFKDGSEATVVFGTENLSSSSCYVWEKGTDVIYLVGVYNRSSTVVTAIDLITSKVFSFSDSGQISKVNINKNGEAFLKLQATISTDIDGTREWTVKYPIERAGDSTTIESLVSALDSMYLSSVQELACEDLSVYGLEPAAFEVSVTDPQKTSVLRVGNLTPDRDYYYVTIDGASDVYLVKTSYVTFTDTPQISFMNKYIFMVSYTKLSDVQLYVLGRTYDLTYAAGETSENDVFTINGINVNQDGNDCRDLFKRIGTAMYGIRLVSLEDEPAEKGETLCRIRYEEQDGTVNVVECFARNETTMYLYLNGEYCGGYGNVYLLTSGNEDYGILGTIENLYAGLKLIDDQAG